MILKLKRIAKRDTYTIGRLYIDGVYFCDTLEDADRGLSSDMPLEVIQRRKVYGETAIPVGAYDVLLTYSPKFAGKKWAKPYNGRLPLLNKVPGYSGVRIHPGNTAKDTLGCILVGRNMVVGEVRNSQAVFEKLMKDHINPAFIRRDKVRIVIE